MKYFIFFIWFAAANLFSSFAFGQKASLEIRAYDSRTESIPRYYSSIWIFKNGKICNDSNATFTADEEFGWLDTGLYQIKYKTYFNTFNTVQVHIKEYKKYIVDLNLNYIDSNKIIFKPIIYTLKPNESYQIIMESKGCFHGIKDTLIIKNENHMYTAFFRSKQKILSGNELIMIAQFEHELKNIDSKNCKCTTIESYTLLYNKYQKTITDDCCQWNGYNYIKRKLFDIEW